MDCKICNKILDTEKRYSIHLCRNHEYTKEEAYREVNNIVEDPICEWCDKPHRTYCDFPKGYRKFCSRSCSASSSKHELMKDEQKSKQLREKVSISVKEQWRTLDQTNRIQKRTVTVKETVSKMSLEERKQKFGHEVSKHSIEALRNFWINGDTQSTIDKRNESIREAWRVRGNEILAKQINTFLKNNPDKQYWEEPEDVNDERLLKILGVL